MTQKKTSMARLWQLALREKTLVVASCVLSALSVAVSFLPFVSVYYIIRELLANLQDLSSMDSAYLMRLGWFAAGSAVGAIFLNFLALMCSHLGAFKTLYWLKLEFTRHLARLPLGFHNRHSSGQLRIIVDENIEKLEGFIAHQLPDVVGALTAPFVMLFIMLFFDWRLGLASLLPVALLFVLQVVMFGGKKADQWMKIYQDALEEMNNASVEYIRGISVVKAFNQSIFSFRKFYDTIKKYGDFALRFTKSYKLGYIIFISLLYNLYLFLIPAIIFLYDAKGDYVSFALSCIFYLIFSIACAGPILKVMYVSRRFQEIAAGIERMDRVLQAQPLPETDKPQTIKDFSISFENVSFKYNQDENAEAVSGVDFKASQGEVTALVGPSGSGKSTLGHLIPRFFDVTEGAIKIGGVDIRDMSSDYLMSLVSFVFQDVFLFKLSVLENLRIGNKSATYEQVVEAAKAAHCHDFIERLPNGYDTVIGSKNVHLSGGERQRLVIARAILKDSPIIVLDEATAFADPENEHKIQMSFARLMRNKTVLIIAHRLSTVRNANNIIVLDSGQIVEEGKHDFLLEKGGLYNKMWKQYTEALGWTLG